MTSTDATVLIVSAHATDFVWRAGGAMALYHDRGCRVCVLVLSYGERGESERLWKEPGMTVERVKQVRRAESERAAEILGAEIRFFDAGDYPLRSTDALIDELVQEYRRTQPTVVLTHTTVDPYNGDHPEAANLALRTRIYAQAAGYPSDFRSIGAPPVFLFEPQQPEQCRFEPQMLLDITSVFERKRQAMQCMEAQEHLWTYYTDLARRRGAQAARNSGQKDIVYAEAYQRVFPHVSAELT